MSARGVRGVLGLVAALAGCAGPAPLPTVAVTVVGWPAAVHGYPAASLASTLCLQPDARGSDPRTVCRLLVLDATVEQIVTIQVPVAAYHGLTLRVTATFQCDDHRLIDAPIAGADAPDVVLSPPFEGLTPARVEVQPYRVANPCP